MSRPAEPPREPSSLSHVGPASGASDGPGEARMVDVGSKPEGRREATARARVRFPRGLLEVVLAGRGPKGPVTEVARVAGIQAAKRTPEWIPMCHLLALDLVEVRFGAGGELPADVLEVRCRVACHGRTGVEMEALVGAGAAALAVYDMTKALDHGIVIEDLRLLEKEGGKSGSWRASDA